MEKIENAKYNFLQCKNCGKHFYSLIEIDVQKQAEQHMFKTGHVVV